MLALLITLVQGALTVAPAVEAVLRQRRAREEEDTDRDVEALSVALQQAWQTFEFHARQRSLTVLALVVTLTILGLAYTVALTGGLPVLAAILGVLGIVAVLFFNRFDALNRSPLHAAERSLAALQQRLAVAAGVPDVVMASGVTGRMYRDGLILLLQAACFAGFFGAFVYALITA